MSAIAFSEVVSGLGLPPAVAAVWAGGWDVSQADYPTGGPPPFLLPDFVREAGDRIGVSAELRDVLLAALPEFSGQPLLCRLAWHLHRAFEQAPGMPPVEVRGWPLLPAGIVPHGDLLLAYVFLASTPRVATFYGERGIPMEVFRETFADFELWIREHRRRTGSWGFSEHRWLVNHFGGILFQLGRLQHQFGQFRYPFHAWRHRRTGRVAVLAGDGVRFTADGLVASADAGLPLGAPYALESGTVRGLLISPRGRALPHAVSLALADWENVLTPGDPVLNLHIPAGSPMDVDQCGISFRKAREFFPRHFPERPYRAFVCGSWLLDPQFEGRLRPTSNIVRFLREVHLFPLPDAGGSAIFQRVFDKPHVDPATAPRDTSLRRAVLDLIEAGGRWRSGGCMLFVEDLERWGHQVYR